MNRSMNLLVPFLDLVNVFVKRLFFLDFLEWTTVFVVFHLLSSAF